MTLPKLDWSDWVGGLVSGVISSGATSAIAAFGMATQDPEHFTDINKIIKSITVAFIIGAILNMLNYLKQKPVPSIVTEVKQSTIATARNGDTEQTVTTVKTTQENPNPFEKVGG